jgi:hypothetical protein
MNSSNIGRSKVLARVPTEKLRHFLGELANTQDDAKAINRFGRRFPEFLNISDWMTWARDKGPDETDESIRQTLFETLLFQFQRGVRKVWEAPDLNAAKWRAFVLQYDIYENEPESQRNKKEEPPRPVPLQQALTYLREHVDVLKRCGNPECAAPYFFAKRRSQRYCSDVCAKPAQMAAKKQWWDEHGDKWRKARAKK